MFLIAITQISTPIAVDLAAVTEPISGIVLLFIAAFAPYMVYRFISFLGFDLYHAMGSEQEAKNAVNRPIPVPAKAQGDGVKKVLDGGGAGNGGSSGSAPAAGGATGKPVVAGSTGGASGSASAGGAGAGTGAGAGAAAGPAAAVVIEAEIAKTAATSGPKLGSAIGGTAEVAAGGAGQTSPQPAPPAQSAPSPNVPTADPAPAKPTPRLPNTPKG